MPETVLPFVLFSSAGGAAASVNALEVTHVTEKDRGGALIHVTGGAEIPVSSSARAAVEAIRDAVLAYARANP